jgi:hypothetical protein
MKNPDDCQSLDDTFAEACRHADEKAARAEGGAHGSGVSLLDFHAHMPTHSYIFAPAREMWPASSVNARVPPIPAVDANGQPVLDEDGKQIKIKASTWLDQHRSVEQMTWAPGEPMLVHNRLISEGRLDRAQRRDVLQPLSAADSGAGQCRRG